MSAIEEFRAAIRAGKLTEALLIVMSQAVELEITTQIAGASPVLRTKINLIQGTIENEINQDFIDNNNYKELQQFHFSQVATAGQTIQNNLESLEKMFSLLTKLQEKQIYEIKPEIKAIETKNVTNNILPSKSEEPAIIPEVEPVVEDKKEQVAQVAQVTEVYLSDFETINLNQNEQNFTNDNDDEDWGDFLDEIEPEKPEKKDKDDSDWEDENDEDEFK